jgi:protein FRG1
LTAIAVDDHRIALKSGYGKFVSVERDDRVTGTAEAIGAREYWEPVFQVRFSTQQCQAE